MKKYAIMLLVVLVVLALLVSCSTSQNGNNVNSSACGHEYENEFDTICNLCGYERQKPLVPPSEPPCEHLWVQNDAEQCEHLQVCTLCGVERGEDGVPNSDNSTENMVFTKNENGNLVNSKGVEYEFLAGEGFLNYLGELEFVGSVEGEEKFSQHLGYTYQTGMFAIKEAENDNLLIRKMPNNEWFSIYRKTSLPKLDYSLENCVRLEFIKETYDASVSHTTCGDGITDKSEILSFIEEVRAQKSPQEAGLYDLVSQPNGWFESCYVCGAIYAFFGEEPNLVVIMQITSYNDLAYSISLDDHSYVLPTEWFTAFQNQ